MINNSNKINPMIHFNLCSIKNFFEIVNFIHNNLKFTLKKRNDKKNEDNKIIQAVQGPFSI
jgi:hypothetical protein